jgi:imidazolonepropionase-like amidohydrolase
MLVIRSTALFDGQGCLPRLATVLVDDGTILGVEQGWPDPPEHAEVLNLGEVTVLPGLVDTHVHLVGDSEWGALDRVAGYSPEAGAGRCRLRTLRGGGRLRPGWRRSRPRRCRGTRGARWRCLRGRRLAA